MITSMFIFIDGLMADGEAEVTCCLGAYMITLLVGHSCSGFQRATVCAKFVCVLGVVPIHLRSDQGYPGGKGQKLPLVCPSLITDCNCHVETGYQQ